MTRRICSGCGHTLVQPKADVDGVMGAHMDKHTAMHHQRGEACWWVLDATPDPVPLVRQLVAIAIAAGVAAVLLAIAAVALATTSDDASPASRECVQAFQIEVGAVTDYDYDDCRDGIADGK